jgi:translation initiation factor IF-1
MIKKYTVDEIIDNKFAVLLERPDETSKIDIKLSDIPIKIQEGDIIKLEIKDGAVTYAEIDKEETEKQRQEVQTLIDELKNRSSKDLKF